MAQFCNSSGDGGSVVVPVLGGRMARQSFIVIVSNGASSRAFGAFRSFKQAEGNAKAWGGYVLPLEREDAPEPWNARRLMRR